MLNALARSDAILAVNTAIRRVPVWPIYLLGALPPVWWFYKGLTGGLGAEPIKAFEHLLGELSLQMLVVILAVTPLRRFTGIALIRFRRAMGHLFFYYVTCHLLVWLVLDVGDLGRIWADIVKRPYITIGMLGFLLVLPVMATSNDASIRKLGAAQWKKVHKLTYAVAILGAVHYVMVVKGWPREPLMYLGMILMLLLLRLRMRRTAVTA